MSHTYRFWYHGAYADVIAESEQAARAMHKDQITIHDGRHTFVCMPLTGATVEQLPDEVVRMSADI